MSAPSSTSSFPSPDGPLLMSMLGSLSLKRLGESTEAGLVQISLPHPPAPLGVTGMGDGAAHVQAIGQWPDAPAGCPRRALITADAPTGAPATLTPRLDAAPTPVAEPPSAEAVCFLTSDREDYMWQSHLLKLTHGDRQFGLALGLRFRNRVNWWQACRLVEDSVTPFCRTVRMAGAIPIDTPTREEMGSYTEFGQPYLHKHNWLNGDLYIRLYANGVVEVFAHHVNSKYVDPGSAFKNVVPVIGFFSYDAAGEPTPREPLSTSGTSLIGDWAGDDTDVRLGDVRLDLTEAAPLTEPEWPGNWALDPATPGATVLQPYYGASLYGGVCALDTVGGPWHAAPQQRIWPQGMARSVRFSLSLAADRSPRIARYLAPTWWYGATAELLPVPHLPVADELDRELETSQIWVQQAIQKRGFEVGMVPRAANLGEPLPPGYLRPEPGWDGDVPYAQILMAYRTGDATDYQQALQSAYHQTDVVTDHTVKLARMHGFPDGNYSLPMTRPLGILTAYLETGDPYLYTVGRGITDTAWLTHQNSWPRLAMGRDGCFVRGAVFLYRYFASEHYRQMARDACLQASQTQRPDGSWGDQGGGTGIHASAGYVTKPWMLCLGSAAILDYLMLQPDDPELRACLIALGDWFVANCWERDGVTGWSYQHESVGDPTWVLKTCRRGRPLPSQNTWLSQQLLALMGYCSAVTGDPKYHDCCMQAYAHRAPQKDEALAKMKADPTTANGGGHGYAAACVYVPLLQALRLRPQWTATGLHTAPIPSLATGSQSVTILTPDGPTTLTL